jgi:D-3-phosphoglycerate dehydrogenase
MAQTILITGPSIAPEAMELMSNNGVRVLNVPPYSSSETVADLVREEQVDGLIVRMGKINSAILEASPRLRVIAKHGVGIDNIDLEAATRLKIPVLITPDANSVSVAEHAVGLMFALAKQMLRLDQRVRRGHWDKSTHKGLELSGKTLGLVGVGRIGRQVILSHL